MYSESVKKGNKTTEGENFAYYVKNQLKLSIKNRSQWYEIVMQRFAESGKNGENPEKFFSIVTIKSKIPIRRS